MQFLTDTHVDFMKYRGVFVWLSVALLIATFVELFLLSGTHAGINLGIDFAGGTQLTVKLRDDVAPDKLRSIFEAAGLRDAQIQRFGGAEDREVLIKTPVKGESEEGSGDALIEALDRDLNGADASRFDLNQRGVEALQALLMDADPDGVRASGEDEAEAHYQQVADAILEARNELSIFTSMEQVTGLEGVSPATASLLQERAYLGAFHVLQNENVGSQIGSELRQKGLLAVTLSLIGMLLYIWYRFELRFGIGALVATFHDFMVTLGLYAIFNFEFNLSTIAAFLTLVGYSVNDTVVIFDRVRENMGRHRRLALIEVINLSLNQTLARTILTSGTTLLAVGALFFLGGEVIRGFAFVMFVGVIIGTYSSVFVASPIVLLWDRYFGQRDDRRSPAEPAPTPTPARRSGG